MSEQAPNTNLVGLVELGRRSDVDIQPTLLRVMTDLYIQKPMHSAEEEQYFTELALRLIDVVDAPTRAIVMERLAAYPAAPAAVRQRLLRDGPATTAAFQSPRTAAPAAHAALAASELSELFLSASADERRLILLNLPYAPLRLAAPIAPAVAREATRRLEAAALAHQPDVFAQELERVLAIPRALARQLIEDASGEPIVVAAVVLAMPPQVLQRILLCLNRHVSQSVQRVYDLASLHEDVALEAALRLIAIWQASGSATDRVRPAHQPQYQPGGANARAAPALHPAIRRDEHAKSRKGEG